MVVTTYFQCFGNTITMVVVLGRVCLVESRLGK